MNQVVERLWVLLHDPEGPLVPYLDSFARSLDEQGFKRHLLGRQIRVAANFSKWLQAEEVAARDVTDEHARRFFERSARQQSVRRGEFATLRRLMDFWASCASYAHCLSMRKPHRSKRLLFL